MKDKASGNEALLESLKQHAQRFAQFPGNENARSNFLLRLQLVDDADALRLLARQLALSPDVAVDVWRRILSLEPDNPRIKTQVASFFYTQGFDSEAGKIVDSAIALDEKYIPAWELKAVLCANAKDRRQIFEHILAIEPGNRNAVDNLIILGRPTA